MPECTGTGSHWRPQLASGLGIWAYRSSRSTRYRRSRYPRGKADWRSRRAEGMMRICIARQR